MAFHNLTNVIQRSHIHIPHYLAILINQNAYESPLAPYLLCGRGWREQCLPDPLLPSWPAGLLDTILLDTSVRQPQTSSPAPRQAGDGQEGEAAPEVGETLPERRRAPLKRQFTRNQSDPKILPVGRGGAL